MRTLHNIECHVLNNGQPVRVSVTRWAKWYLRSFEERLVAEDTVGGCYVTTFFYGFDSALWVTHVEDWPQRNILLVAQSKSLNAARRRHRCCVRLVREGVPLQEE